MNGQKETGAVRVKSNKNISRCFVFLTLILPLINAITKINEGMN